MSILSSCSDFSEFRVSLHVRMLVYFEIWMLNHDNVHCMCLLPSWPSSFFEYFLDSHCGILGNHPYTLFQVCTWPPSSEGVIFKGWKALPLGLKSVGTPDPYARKVLVPKWVEVVKMGHFPSFSMFLTSLVLDLGPGTPRGSWHHWFSKWGWGTFCCFGLSIQCNRAWY